MAASHSHRIPKPQARASPVSTRCHARRPATGSRSSRDVIRADNASTQAGFVDAPRRLIEFGYDPRMVKSLSFDAILAALAVLSVNAGCSKTEPAAPAPETTTPTTTNAGPTAAVPPPPPAVTAAATAATTATTMAVGSPLVDAGKERPKAAAPKQEAPASCGANGCSPDMKKNGK